MKRIVTAAFLALSLIGTKSVQAQQTSRKAVNNSGAKPSLAIVSIDVTGLPYDNLALASLVRLELEKIGKFEVLDKYDVAATMRQNSIKPEEAFGKRTLVKVGQLLKADKMLTGSAELFGEKIIFTLRMIDVREEKIERTSVLEYINNQKYIERMVHFSVNDILEIENDPKELEQLISFNRPIVNKETVSSLNGPRFGIQVFGGDIANRLTDPLDEGGFNANSFASVFGYQFEKQYLSAGQFQALFECIVSVNGIETGMIVPSISILHGMRFKGWEFGIGPVFRLNRVASGFYDNGTWVYENEIPEGIEVNLQNRIDKKGDVQLNTGLVFALGKTFTSGNLHFPVNFYYSPMPEFDSHVMGVILGFTIAK